MKWLNSNRGNIIITLAVAVLGVFLGLLVHGLRYGTPAEAVLGGVGNVTNYSNPHNLAANSSGIKADSETQICIFCHTPHHALNNSADNLINAPLWNHKLSTVSYLVKTAGTTYSNMISPGSPPITNLLTQPPAKPDGASKLCLSCHDGYISLGDLSSGYVDMDNANTCITAGTAPTGDMLTNAAGCAGLSNDLTQKHVVSIPMNDALITAAKANCPPPDGTGPGSVTHKLSYPWKVTAMKDIVLLRPTAEAYGGSPGRTNPGPSASTKYKDNYNYGVQCSTCHDPHLWASTTPYSTGWKFLVTDFNSLCDACHYQCGLSDR